MLARHPCMPPVRTNSFCIFRLRVICCTVRGDLVRILHKLLSRKDRFDAILIETTGLADPAPVAQTFFVDESLAGQLRLDAIITVVDAKHIEQHLDEEKPDGVENEVSVCFPTM